MARHKMSRLERGFYRISRERKLEEQNNKCFYCKKPLNRSTATMDHKIPLKITKHHSDLNTVVSCSDCNTKKSDKKAYAPDPFEVKINEMFERLEQRVRLAEYRLSFDTKGSFNKWLKYHEKRGRWANRVFVRK